MIKGPSLTIETDPPLRLLSLGDSAPGLAFALIGGVGPIRRPADGSEAGNVSLDLDNGDGLATGLFWIPPLRARCVLYGPDGEEWFRGTLAGVSLGASASLSLEA
ncbi:MAG: hypothetical protein V9G63_16250 [Candidatus Competibacter sp.]|jgi:hypothetical protein|nr:hypothetical protein [Candidatus Competibacteraceae bacterium]